MKNAKWLNSKLHENKAMQGILGGQNCSDRN